MKVQLFLVDALEKSKHKQVLSKQTLLDWKLQVLAGHL